MKKFLLLAFISINATSIFSQTNWKINGNTVISGDWIGTLNTEPLIFRTDNAVRFRINANGNIIFKEFDGIGTTGLFGYNANGRLVGTPYSGLITDVLRGDGTFGPILSAGGWNNAPGISWTGNKVGIFGITMPVEALEVNGNAIFNGSVNATQFNAGDIESSGRQLKITSGLCLKGYDPSVDGSRTEICGMGNDLFLQSNAFDKHTILNYSNGGLVGIGTNNPLAKLHVEGSFRVDGEANFSGNIRVHRILPNAGDTLIHFGDSSYTFASNNRFFWTPAFGGGFIQGFGFGNGFVQAAGLNSIAMGFASNCNANYSLVLGKWLSSSGESRFVLGTGAGNGASQRLVNAATDNSLVIGFNSNIPTFFVGPSAGVNTTGNVGIGTTVVEDKFQIKTGVYKLTVGNALFEDLRFGTAYIGFNSTRISAGTWKTETDGLHNGGAIIYSNVLGNFYFSTVPDNGAGASGQSGISDLTIVDNTRLYIDGATGNVAIGTTCIPADAKLAVDGTIRGRKAVIETVDWCDYVFGNTYKPLSLLELEKYLQLNKHLPNFSSHEVYIKEGVDIVETQKALLKTVEEEAIYIIELKKELNETKEEIKLLREMIEEIKKDK